ncbi:MAG TPA: DUF6285 domain-containing protein [Hyphomicrobiaceae bacterium]|nr:DUF6285 domain-containing protein [Hyphomicrobiaceae bacterium]
MTTKRIAPEDLIALASEMLRDEIVPVLPAGQRYAAAMIANALEIARRGITGDTESAAWALLDQIYDEGEGTLDQLARDIRSGEIDTDTNPDLAARLKAIVQAELRVTNPRFLASRGVR